MRQKSQRRYVPRRGALGSSAFEINRVDLHYTRPRKRREWSFLTRPLNVTRKRNETWPDKYQRPATNFLLVNSRKHLWPLGVKKGRTEPDTINETRLVITLSPKSSCYRCEINERRINARSLRNVPPCIAVVNFANGLPTIVLVQTLTFMQVTWCNFCGGFFFIILSIYLFNYSHLIFM